MAKETRAEHMRPMIWEANLKIQRLTDDCGIRAKELRHVIKQGSTPLPHYRMPRCLSYIPTQMPYGSHKVRPLLWRVGVSTPERHLLPPLSIPCFPWSGHQEILGLLSLAVESQVDHSITVRFAGSLILSIYLCSIPSEEACLKVLESSQKTNHPNAGLPHGISLHT